MHILDLVAINTDAVLNTFLKIGTAKFVAGQAFDMMFILVQPEKKGIRYVPAIGATLSLTLTKSDGTTVVLAGTFPFADDRSIIKFSVSALQSTGLVGQNLLVVITEGSEVSTAYLAGGLQQVLTSGC